MCAQLLALSPDLEIVVTREPGNSSIGDDIRNLLLHKNEQVSSRTEALLFAAERAQHVEEVIRPALERGALVICDRFVDSSVAYQGVARSLGAEDIAALSDFATNGVKPDITYIFDVDPIVGLARKHDQKELNSMERESLEFHQVVRDAFRETAERENALLIDAHQSIESATSICVEDVRTRLSL